MKKGIILALSAVIALVAIQWLIPSDDTLIKSQVTQDVPLAVEGDTKSRADKSLQVVKQSKDAKKESATTSAPTEAESSLDDPAARSLAYQEATVTFKSLGASEKRQRRKTALGKVIAGKGVGVEDEVALQQAWELVGEAEPGYQHKKDTTKIDVNGTIVDVAQPGVVVADSVMVYIPQSKAALVAELGAVAGISNIEPLFKNAKPSTVAGVRDLSGWQKIELSAPASRIRSIVRALKAFDGVTEAEPVYERKLSITGPLVSDLNDPLMSDQWHLDAAKIKEAWAFWKVIASLQGVMSPLLWQSSIRGLTTTIQILRTTCGSTPKRFLVMALMMITMALWTIFTVLLSLERVTAIQVTQMMTTGTVLMWQGLLHRQGAMASVASVWRTTARLWRSRQGSTRAY